MELPYDAKIPLLGIYSKRIESRDSNRFVYQCHSSIIHNTQKVVVTQMYING